jgi:cyclic beta-1,2-glucan synthetase
LYLDPCIPRAWPRFEVSFRYHSARYELLVENPYGVTRGISKIEMDGLPVEVSTRGIPLQDDGITHRIRATLG